MINWKVRFKHKQFLVSLFAAVILFAQEIGTMFGFSLDQYIGDLTDLFNSALAILVILGIVIDPTTNDIADSELAKTYNEPKRDVK